jgi:predicted ArsR family transcriptional regulator
LAVLAELRNTYVVKNKDQDRTRDQVARSILESGPATAVDLAQKLKITPAGIRRHLDYLTGEGVLTAREPHQTSFNLRGRGRPAKVFIMTDIGREKFEHSYDDLAVSALKFMAAKNGSGLVSEFAQLRAHDIERRATLVLDRVDRKSLIRNTQKKVIALTQFLSDEGFAAKVNPKGMGTEICQHHCPIAHVAAEFPQLCDAETEALSRLLGTHVQRLATIAHGDGVCTTFIPASTAEKRVTR